MQRGKMETAAAERRRPVMATACVRAGRRKGARGAGKEVALSQRAVSAKRKEVSGPPSESGPLLPASFSRSRARERKLVMQREHGGTRRKWLEATGGGSVKVVAAEPREGQAPPLTNPGRVASILKQRLSRKPPPPLPWRHLVAVVVRSFAPAAAFAKLARNNSAGAVVRCDAAEASSSHFARELSSAPAAFDGAARNQRRAEAHNRRKRTGMTAEDRYRFAAPCALRTEVNDLLTRSRAVPNPESRWEFLGLRESNPRRVGGDLCATRRQALNMPRHGAPAPSAACHGDVVSALGWLAAPANAAGPEMRPTASDRGQRHHSARHTAAKSTGSGGESSAPMDSDAGPKSQAPIASGLE
ncbi:hypothetical protein MRX96_008246 [Rhipicephalus microplus]